MSRPSANACFSCGMSAICASSAQLDLRVVRRDQLVALRRDERRADASAFLGADRNVLQVRIVRRQPAGRSSRPARRWCARDAVSRVHVGRQRVGIGRLQLRELAPLQNLLRGSRSPAPPDPRAPARVVDHAPVLVFVPPGSLILPNRMSPSCLGAADVELLRRRSPAISSSTCAAVCAKSPDSRDSTCRSIEMPRAFHPRQHGHQRPLQRLVDCRQAVGDEARLQHAPQPQRRRRRSPRNSRSPCRSRPGRRSACPCRCR